MINSSVDLVKCVKICKVTSEERRSENLRYFREDFAEFLNKLEAASNSKIVMVNNGCVYIFNENTNNRVTIDCIEVTDVDCDATDDHHYLICGVRTTLYNDNNDTKSSCYFNVVVSINNCIPILSSFLLTGVFPTNNMHDVG